MYLTKKYTERLTFHFAFSVVASSSIQSPQLRQRDNWRSLIMPELIQG